MYPITLWSVEDSQPARTDPLLLVAARPSWPRWDSTTATSSAISPPAPSPRDFEAPRCPGDRRQNQEPPKSGLKLGRPARPPVRTDGWRPGCHGGPGHARPSEVRRRRVGVPLASTNITAAQHPVASGTCSSAPRPAVRRALRSLVRQRQSRRPRTLTAAGRPAGRAAEHPPGGVLRVHGGRRPRAAGEPGSGAARALGRAAASAPQPDGASTLGGLCGLIPVCRLEHEAAPAEDK
jgi:hypothetical protein